jgi:molybdopterin molybdotransferase
MDIKTMISFEEALVITKSFALPFGTERLDLFGVLNRILAEDIYSDLAMPPFNKSAMDGFACRKSDLKNLLYIIEDIGAGAIPTKTVGENQCSRIMTGAMVPEGADVVIMKEDTEVMNPECVRFSGQYSRTNICYQGEDIRAGDLVLKNGDLILPAQIAILASVGCSNPMVYKVPTVAIISTGNELVEPDQNPGISKIRNSNSYQLAAQVHQMGISPVYLGIIKDNEQDIQKMLITALEKFDITIISGGVSVGDFDFVPKILNELKVNIRVHGMNVRPGKHLLFGEKANHFIFGMPGNPVSSFVQFEVLVRPFINRLMGKTKVESFFHLPIEEDYIRKKGDLLIFVPVAFTTQGTVQPLEYHGSAHIHAYSFANGIMEVPPGISMFKKGETVRVRPL